MKLGIRKLFTIWLGVSMHQTPLSAGTLSMQAWGRIAADLHLKNLDQNDPSTDGSVQKASDNTLESTPELALGLNFGLFERVNVSSYVKYQHRYLGSETKLYPRPFEKQKDYPDSLVQQVLSAHFGMEVPVHQHFALGIATDKQWGHSRWEGETWDAYTRLSIFPWLGVLWNEAHQSYLSFLIEQNLHGGDEERTYKIQSGLFSEPSVRVSHVYSYSDRLRFGVAGLYQKRIFEDFWYDQIEKGVSLGANWFVLENLSVSTLLGGTRREFIHPWKRNGPCGEALGARSYDFYWYDAGNCYRIEAETFLQVGVTWEIFREFRLGTFFEMTDTHSREEEFANLKRGFLVSVSWETEKTQWSDPLRAFLPWYYIGRTLH